MIGTNDFAELLRPLTPQVLAALVRRYGHFDESEDAVQEALLAAARQWPTEGVPDSPRSWLITVASRRLIDQWRSDQARRRREEALLTDDLRSAHTADVSHQDDTLELLFLCCHPDLSGPSQIALTLRAVGGLSTAEIAHAFLVPESTMAQRISRAKQRIKSSTLRISGGHREDRLPMVLQVLYLIFNEGYTSSSGPSLQRTELTAEAIRLTRQALSALPGNGEVAGLLALMMLTDSRRAARTGADGGLIPLDQQERALWNQQQIGEGIELITTALTGAVVGPYQVQAAIAAVHAEAVTAADTDWLQIAALYKVLTRLSPNPMVTLNQAVAVSMTDGPQAGLRLLADLDGDPRMTANHRLDAVRAHLHEMAGDPAAALEHYRRAARRTTSIPEKRYLQGRIAGLS